MKRQAETERSGLAAARRIVVKAGSRVLVQRNGRPDPVRLKRLVDQLVRLQKGGAEVVLVSSGAVGAGMEGLGRKTRPTRLPDLQMAAAVGQTRLMQHYAELFAAHRIQVGQVLLTHDDLKHRQRHLNARNTVMNLLRHGIVPIINENDVVAVDEIKVGDNDELAALAAILIDADALVLLTTINGLREPDGERRTRRIPWIEKVTPDVLALARGKGSALSTGGMGTKLLAAQMTADLGIPAVIADGRKAGILDELFAGGDTGTLVGRVRGSGGRSLNRRKRWIAYFHRPEGTLEVDRGAGQALLRGGKSLLPIGIRNVIGDFGVGAVVNIHTTDGTLLARGLVDYDSDQVRRIMGRKTADIEPILGSRDFDEVVHRDNMVILIS